MPTTTEVIKMPKASRLTIVLSVLLMSYHCGALAAAVWMNALSRIRDKTYKASFSDPVAENILRTFFDVAGSELDCRVIAGRCGSLIQALAGAVSLR